MQDLGKLVAFVVGFRWAQRVRERRAGQRPPARWPEWLGRAVLVVVVAAALRLEVSELVADGLAAVLFVVAACRRRAWRDGGRRGRADGADNPVLLLPGPLASPHPPVRQWVVEARQWPDW